MSVRLVPALIVKSCVYPLGLRACNWSLDCHWGVLEGSFSFDFNSLGRSEGLKIHAHALCYLQKAVMTLQGAEQTAVALCTAKPEVSHIQMNWKLGGGAGCPFLAV